MVKKVTIIKTVTIIACMMCVLMSVMPLYCYAELDPSKTVIVNESKVGADAVNSIQDKGSQILTIITVIGAVASAVLIAVLGVKYMMGSPEEKSDYKKSMMPLFVGAVCVFLASTIAGIIFNFLKSA